MRSGVLAGALALFLAWFVVKAVPFLTEGRPAIWATPTALPFQPDRLKPVTVPARGRACIDGVEWAPEARYVSVAVLPGVHRRTEEIGVEARARGYRANGVIGPGLGQNERGYARIAPAPREVTGSVCIVNRGGGPLALFGVPKGGREQAAVNVTIDGREVADRQLSITLLTDPSQSTLGRFGTVVGHVATFRPISTWMVWIVLLLVIGTPVAVGGALARAAFADDVEGDGDA
jgi:hypothetical protein